MLHDVEPELYLPQRLSFKVDAKGEMLKKGVETGACLESKDHAHLVLSVCSRLTLPVTEEEAGLEWPLENETLKSEAASE